MIVDLNTVCSSISNTHKFKDLTKVVFLNTSDVFDGTFLHNNYTELYKLPGQAKKKIAKGDIVLSEIRPINKRYAYVDFEAKDHVVSTKFIVIRANDRILPEYLYIYLTAEETLKKLQQIAETRSGTFPQITFESIKDLSLYLPSKEEQSDISKLIFSLKKEIENLKKQNAILENIAQTLFKQWFIDFEFPDTNGNPYNSSGGKMIDSEMGKIPKGWKIGSFGGIAETVGGGTPSTNEEAYWQDGDIQWYSPTDLTKSNQLFSLSSDNKISRLGLQKSSAKLFPPHSIMLTSRATVGEISINCSEASTNQGFITIIPNSRFTLPFLLGYVKFNLPIIKSLASGSTFPEISKTNFRNIGLFIPTDEIINEFTKASMPLLMKIESNIKIIQKLNNLKEILLPKLMSGQLRINA